MDSTYLEEFLLSIEGMPNDVRRDFELMRDLDRETLDLNRELVELEEKMVARANSRAEARQPTVLQFNGKLKESSEVAAAVAASTADGNKEVTPAPPRVGDVHTDAQDPEGGVMLAEINAVRAKISSRLTEKTAIAKNLYNVLTKVTRKLDTDLAFFETDLRSCGDFDLVAGALPGSEVAFRPVLNGEDLLLGRVILYHADIGCYDIADVDDSQRYHVPEPQVTVLDLVDSSRKLSKGDPVYAVYPDTTAFYLATVTAAPRRGVLGSEPVLTVQFAGDDADVTGQVPHKTVPLKYVIRA